MAELDDLKKAVTDVKAAQAVTSAALKDLAAKLAAIAGQTVINPADVEAAAQSLEATATAMVSDANSADPAPPAGS